MGGKAKLPPSGGRKPGRLGVQGRSPWSRHQISPARFIFGQWPSPQRHLRPTCTQLLPQTQGVEWAKRSLTPRPLPLGEGARGAVWP